MKKNFKILAKNESASYSSETIVYCEQKFRIVAKNGNCYSKLDVYTYTQNGDLGLVASAEDILGYKVVHYFGDDAVRIAENAQNIKVAEEYIINVFS